MGASTKVQLGARVTPELREGCVAAAKRAGVSLNVWVERELARGLEGAGIEQPVQGLGRVEGASRVAGRRAEEFPPVTRAPGDAAAAKAKREAPPSRRVADSRSAKAGVRPIPKSR